MNRLRRHFHTFDAFRFFAFFLVFISHIPLPGFDTINLFQKSGGTGVTFFFVLSGFLISYLLMVEKQESGGIHLGKFFIRRVLRIWPLFYLMLGVAFLTPYLLEILDVSYSNEGYEPNWLMSCLFLENYQMIRVDSFPNTSPMRVMWTLCIEEHFYIVWGLLFAFLPFRSAPWIAGISILGAPIFRYWFHAQGWNDIDLLTNMDYFGYGTAAAYLLVRYPRQIEKIKRIPKSLVALVVVLTVTLVFAFPHLDSPIWLSPICLGILFIALLLFTFPSSPVLRIRDSNVLSKLGVFTYGLYLYHTLVINLLIQVNKRLGWEIDTLLDALWFFVISLALTILISMASYHWFERIFIRFKRYFYPT